MTGLPAGIGFLCISALLLLCIGWCDLKRGVIPDRLNLALAGLAFGHAAYGAGSLWALVDMAAQAMLAWLALAWGAALMARIFPPRCIGWGDIKFLVASALWVGFAGCVALLAIATSALALHRFVEYLKATPAGAKVGPRFIRAGPALVGSFLLLVLIRHIAGGSS